MVLHINYRKLPGSSIVSGGSISADKPMSYRRKHSVAGGIVNEVLVKALALEPMQRGVAGKGMPYLTRSSCESPMACQQISSACPLSPGKWDRCPALDTTS